MGSWVVELAASPFRLLRSDFWSPFSIGWGASPFNLNCRRAAEGKPVLPDGIEGQKCRTRTPNPALNLAGADAAILNGRLP